MSILTFAIRVLAGAILFTAFGVTWLNVAVVAVAALLYSLAGYLEGVTRK